MKYKVISTKQFTDARGFSAVLLDQHLLSKKDVLLEVKQIN